MSLTKPTHTIILDAGPIIKNEPSVSTLLASSEALVTSPTVIAEIRDATTRARVETLLKPFLTLRQPKPSSLQFVAQFARKTGDYAVLSKTDLELIALAYDIECERNDGDWRLRNTPGQKQLNGSPPRQKMTSDLSSNEVKAVGTENAYPVADSQSDEQVGEDDTTNANAEANSGNSDATDALAQNTADLAISSLTTNPVAEVPESMVADTSNDPTGQVEENTPTTEESEDQASEDSGSEGWITPANFKKHQAKEANAGASEETPQKTLQAAIITTDFPMQNVILQMNLNLLSGSLQRVRNIRSFVLRCHACFGTTKDMTKQFCPRCGKPTLTKVTCTTNSKGEYQLHLKKNFQWNKRGDRYSIPKAVHGAAHGRVKGGGKGSWGNELLLAEDQKEYSRAVTLEKRQKQRDLMDDDLLPSILTGQRNNPTGRPRVGAGRNVNSKKRN
ncbi:putative art-4 protein [Pseudovirgaria hyperparasitica]|uniref:20S-pre-rRNA D-site endonuclease NOB1 n=1 Tax=Pseudovirgaria hyperparasitica TaxID=470096 RepID=A0A6A6VWY9_9PEZI|nr:putative art-4 protein [Pseudovirgaria hyperparasitica]KAF2754733.1 putative art-4 protein [Pseudovirgaria hyperparasitica]